MIGAEGGDNATAKVMVVVAKTNENNIKFMINSKRKRKFFILVVGHQELH